MSVLRVLVLALCVALPCAASSSRAQSADAGEAQPTEAEQAEEARAHFTRGNELYAGGDLHGTLAEFERAYALRPSPLLSFHIARVALELKLFARSYRAFTRFLATSTPSDAASEQRRAEALLRTAELAPFIAQLRIETNVPGARISIDEEPVGDAPLAGPFVLDVGTYRVRAAKVGHVAVTRVVTLTGGDSLSLLLELEPLQMAAPLPVAPPVVAPAPVAPPAPPSPLMTRGLWLGFATAGALTVAGGVTGIYALRASSDLERTRYSGDRARTSYQSDRDHVRTLSITADVLLGAAIVSAQTSLIVLVWRARHPHAGAGPRPFVSASLDSASLMLEGDF